MNPFFRPLIALGVCGLLGSRAQAQFVPLPFYVSGISGDTVYGNNGGKGFLYSHSKYTTLSPNFGNYGANFFVSGVDGNKVFGGYTGTFGKSNGFVYDGAYYGQILANNADTSLAGFYGDKLVGTYLTGKGTFGFVSNGAYNSSDKSVTTISDPRGYNGTTAIAGVSGSNIIGNYSGNKGQHGFLYQNGTYKDIFDPSAVGYTAVTGIKGAKIIGNYTTATQINSFLYENGIYTDIIDPLGVNGTYVSGISGNDIVGSYVDKHGYSNGFLYTGSTYITIDDPLGTQGTYLVGVSGNTIVGNYYDASGEHGFLYNAVPEPGVYALLASFGLMGASLLRRRRASRQGDNLA